MKRTLRSTSPASRASRASSNKMADKFGPLVRLWGFNKSQLPERTATAEELTPLLTSLLLEAAPFIASIPPAQNVVAESAWKPKGIKTFPHSTAPVDIYERVVPTKDLQTLADRSQLPQLVGVAKVPAEHWFMRRSIHEDKPAEGTASWDEWVRNFKEEHAESEKQFTRTITHTEILQEWDCSGTEVDLDGQIWSDWTLKLEQSTHKMPTPLKPRLFPVLQATASNTHRREFVVVQVAFRDRDLESQGSPGHVRGSYTSIERLREVDEGRSIEWVMATTSDAKGVLPAWLQRAAMPGAVSKDVDMFLHWAAKQRQAQDGVNRKNGSAQKTGTTANLNGDENGDADKKGQEPVGAGVAGTEGQVPAQAQTT